MKNWMHHHTITCPQALRHDPKVLVIGNMEGIHLGHSALLNMAKTVATENDWGTAVLTFSPHPREFFQPECKPLSIMRPFSKIQTLINDGAETIVMLAFNQQLAEMSAVDFIKDVCVKQLQAQHIITGANFRFGKNREGDADLIADTMHQLGLGYSCVPPVMSDDGQVISSSRIREALAAGNITLASQLLGRPYMISGKVMHGDKRGRVLGFPTANIALRHIFLPKFGVYAVLTRIDNQPYQGVANLGLRPTFNGITPQLEVHLFDVNQSLYGKRLHIELHEFIRPELRFTTTELLIDQMHQDVLQARHYFQLPSN